MFLEGIEHALRFFLSVFFERTTSFYNTFCKLVRKLSIRVFFFFEESAFSLKISHSHFTLANFSFVNLVFIFRSSSSTTNPVCARCVDLFVCSLPLLRHSHICFILVFASSFHNKQTASCDYQCLCVFLCVCVLTGDVSPVLKLSLVSVWLLVLMIVYRTL